MVSQTAEKRDSGEGTMIEIEICSFKIKAKTLITLQK